MSKGPYRGVFPVVPTIFNERGALDLPGQLRAVDFMIDAGSHGLCILANFSEQFVLTDTEREQLMDAILKHVAGRVPVIVTTTHFSSTKSAMSACTAGSKLLLYHFPQHMFFNLCGEDVISEFNLANFLAL